MISHKSNQDQAIEEENLDRKKDKKEMKKHTNLVDVISKWLEIQDAVNAFYDSTKALKRQDREGTLHNGLNFRFRHQAVA